MPRIGRGAALLGYAGLLPQIGAMLLLVLGWRSGSDLAGLLALVAYWGAITYGALILSFLGGIWWGFAVRRDAGQGLLAAAAVVPSLFAFAVLAWAVAPLPELPSPWPLIALGAVILLTLPVDRHLARTGEAPMGWMALRIPLSLGLGGLTIAAGILYGSWRG